jgi:ParB family chromosome partitioning protein
MGLSALLGTTADSYADGAAPSGAQRVPVEFLRPSSLQPRRRFDEAELEALAQSIRDRGVLQPLLVRPAADGAAGYEIVAGERRWRAAQLAGQHEIPVVVRELDDRETLELALIENLQRADLSPLDEAHAYRRLMNEFAHTQEALAEAVGRSRSHVANTLRLLGLPRGVQELLEDGRLSAGHARALLGSPNPDALARVVVERNLSVRETEALVRHAAKAAPRRRNETHGVDPNAAELSRQLTARLGLEVGIRTRGSGGTLTIRYSDLNQLDGLIRRLQ